MRKREGGKVEGKMRERVMKGKGGREGGRGGGGGERGGGGREGGNSVVPYR